MKEGMTHGNGHPVREAWLRREVLPLYKRKLWVRRLAFGAAAGSYALYWLYGKYVRVMDLIEYEVYIK
jgi:hypothetical protein